MRVEVAADASLQRVEEFPLPEVDLWSEYQLVRALGEGHFARVLLARHRHTNTTVVLKAVHAELTASKDFQREFHYSYLLSAHPAILNVYPVAFRTTQAGCYVFATEWAPCGDLAGAVAKAPGPSEAAVRGVAAQIGSALDFMHSKNLAHRDLKLENILVFSPDLSRVKLADMGSTRRAGSLVSPVQTWRPFLPPEECGVLPKEKYTCSVAGDTWQLAILVLVALSGAPPWRSADISDFDYCQFARWQKRRTTKLPAKFKAYTPRFLRLLRRMLEPKVDKRAPISDVQKYVSDSWLVVSRGVPQLSPLGAATPQKEEDSDSLLYLNSRGDQSKRGLAKLLSSYGLETTVDRQEMTRRLCEWVLSCDTSDDGSVTESV